MPNPLLDSALAYAARGWRVHPLKPRDKTPITKNGCKDATLDEATIRRWWSRWPSANVGLATGWEFFVLDIDTKSGGMAWLEANELPTTHEATTGSGGKHLLYRMPPGIIVQNSAGLIAPGVDVRGVGGYIVAAPSVHPNGTPYLWLDCDDIPDGPCADAPPWLLDMCVKITRSTEHFSSKFVLPERIMKGTQHTTLFKYACSLRSKTMGTEEEIAQAVILASKRCEEIPPEINVRKIVASACKLPAGLSPEFAEKKMDAYLRQLAYSSNSAPTGLPPDAGDDDPDDDGSAKPKLAPNQIAENILKDNPVINVDGHVYEYIGTHWDLISAERLKALARQYDSPRWTSQKRRSEVASYIQASTHRSKQRWRNLEKFEIPLANGVIDIRSMSMRPHRQDDYLQACIPHEYNSSATCPVWQECLDTYFGGDIDQDAKQDALQEFFGYCLMPHATYKKALLCKGESDCGKSTIPYLLRVLVGQQNACAVGVESMDDPRKRAPLRGKLVNLLTELTSDAMIADGGFKTLVSTEEPILFDEKFLPPVLDVPIAKHVIVTNVLPTINDRSRGTFNRLLLISFNHVIPLAQQDRAIWDKLQGEIQGILHWALYGAQRLYLSGGTFSVVGRDEVDEYRADQNPLTEFLKIQCEVDADSRVGISDLRGRFSEWYGKRVQPHWFAALVRAAGFEITKNAVHFGQKRDRAVLGLRLP